MTQLSLYNILIVLQLATVWRPIFGDTPWNNLKVKWTPAFQGYYDVPLKKSEIKKNEYVVLGKHPEFDKVTIYCYPDDPRVCVFYDEHGGVAGLRTSFVQKHLTKNVKKGKHFEPEMIYKKPFYKEGTFFNEKVYYREVLFVSPAHLKSGGLKERKEKVGEGVYLNIDGHGWTQIPRKESEVTAHTKFKKQKCFVGMGMHYFYDLTEQSKCEDNNPLFLLYHGGELIGLGLQGFGADTPHKRNWYEAVPKAAVKMISPKSPKCLAEWVENYGLMSLHIYFQTHPRFNCIISS